MADSQTFSKILKAKTIDIDASKLIAILHEDTARDVGVLPLDRVNVRNKRSGKSINAVVDTTDTIIKQDEIGIFNDIAKLLGLKEGSPVEIVASGKPKSLDYVKKKMRGEKLSEDELKQIVEDISSNKLSEIETAAFVSGVYIRGFDLDETVYMTKALLENGKKLELNGEMIVDKHSIGGTNGRATMIITPIIAAAGFTIPKTSSRAITSASGTADAMEVLANVSLNIPEIKKVVRDTGACIVWGGAVELAPADDKIIKVEHPLSLDPEGQVIASVMAKKASVGAQYVVIDIPIGPYAKIKSSERAEEMALKFVEVGKKLGINVEVLLTNGSEPSGLAFGPSLEAKYVMEILEGKFFDNLAQKSVELAGALLELTGEVPKGQGFEKALSILKSGEALKKMKEIIHAQGGKIYNSEEIDYAKYKVEIYAMQSGEISSINLGLANKIARTAGAPADKKAGVMFSVEPGSKVSKGDVLFEIYAENQAKLNSALMLARTTKPVEFERIVLSKVS